MNADGQLLLLDTSVILHLIRGKATGLAIDAAYNLRTRPERRLISVISRRGLMKLLLDRGARCGRRGRRRRRWWRRWRENWRLGRRQQREQRAARIRRPRNVERVPSLGQAGGEVNRSAIEGVKCGDALALL